MSEPFFNSTQGISSTRSFLQNTLDNPTTGILPFMMAYWDGSTLPNPNRSPSQGQATAGSLKANTSTVTIVSGQIDLADPADSVSAFLPWAPDGGEYTVSFEHTPDDGTPAVESNILAVDSFSIAINILSGGEIRLYHNGASSWVDSPSPVFTTGVKTRITVTRRYVAGTKTVFVYANGVEVINSTGLADALVAGNRLLLGTAGSSASTGAYRKIVVLDRGITATQEALLGANDLRGYGLS